MIRFLCGDVFLSRDERKGFGCGKQYDVSNMALWERYAGDEQTETHQRQKMGERQKQVKLVTSTP